MTTEEPKINNRTTLLMFYMVLSGFLAWLHAAYKVDATLILGILSAVGGLLGGYLGIKSSEKPKIGG